MQDHISILQWKSFVETRQKKKLLVKLIWNDTDKLTLLLSPDMKVNSFIYDEKEGYLFYDMEGSSITSPIPSIIPNQAITTDGQILLKAIADGRVSLFGKSLSRKELAELSKLT